MQRNANCTCGCCAGISVMTPQGESNLPGLSAIAYRTGTWATFKASMLARLSSADYPALAQLKTRDDDDFSIALLDATSVVLDILTFYQERLANESYLRTATQLRSLTELARLIGYQPAPGRRASTYLAFSLKAATGLPANPATSAITIPKGPRCRACLRRDRSRRPSRPPPTSSPRRTGMRCRCRPAFRGKPGARWPLSERHHDTTATRVTRCSFLGADRENWNPAIPRRVSSGTSWC